MMINKQIQHQGEKEKQPSLGVASFNFSWTLLARFSMSAAVKDKSIYCAECFAFKKKFSESYKNCDVNKI